MATGEFSQLTKRLFGARAEVLGRAGLENGVGRTPHWKT